MKKDLLSIVGSLVLFSVSTIAVQGCSGSDSPYRYGYGPAYYSGSPYYSEPGYYAEHLRDRDIDNDARAIRQGQANIRHDKRELREDLENHDYGAAAHEQAE